MTRIGVDRVLKFAFELAQKTPKKHLTSATKSNGIAITMPYWDERVEAMAKNFPDIKWDKYHIDILSALFVLKPDRFNVVVASNLFGDILSDLGPACTGTIGIAPSGNINPERKFPSVFEPVHGSAPDIAGQGIANPVGQIWSAAMMLEHLGESEAAAAIVKAIEQALAEPKTRTRDLGGTRRHDRGRQGGRRAPRLMMAKPVALTKAHARRIWLRAQRLDEAAPFGDGPEATRAAVEHLGYVQIDTINVVERCHHQILYTRIPDYQRDHLRQAQSVDKTVFEYWTHALSYVPTADMRFFVRAMKREWQQRSVWFTSVKPADLRKVLSRIRRNGALTIRDIDDDVLVEKDHEWASRKPSKRALQLAFYRGVLTVSQREGMLKTYELTTRHFGWDRLPKAGVGERDASTICSIARCGRRASSASIRSAISTRRARRRSGG